MKRKTSWNLAMKSNRWTRLRDVRSASRIGLFRGSFPWRLQNFPREVFTSRGAKIASGPAEEKDLWDWSALPPRTGENKKPLHSVSAGSTNTSICADNKSCSLNLLIRESYCESLI
jgi:hypothetical protein